MALILDGGVGVGLVAEALLCVIVPVLVFLVVVAIVKSKNRGNTLGYTIFSFCGAGMILFASATRDSSIGVAVGLLLIGPGTLATAFFHSRYTNQAIRSKRA